MKALKIRAKNLELRLKFAHPYIKSFVKPESMKKSIRIINEKQ